MASVDLWQSAGVLGDEQHHHRHSSPDGEGRLGVRENAGRHRDQERDLAGGGRNFAMLTLLWHLPAAFVLGTTVVLLT